MPNRVTLRMKVILPKGKFETKYYRDAWERTLRETVKPDLESMFKDTVDGWEEKPIFRGTINKSTYFLRLLVTATGAHKPLYEMIDITGAKPHPIEARNAPMLMYQPGYTSSTRPRVLKSRRKSRSGPIRTARRVYHPGFEAREFSSEIAKAYISTFEFEMTKATEKATKELGRHI